MNEQISSRRQFGKALCGAALVFGSIRAALAHARLVRSQPMNGEKLAKPPTRIELWFNETLDQLNTVRVYTAGDKEKKNLAVEEPKISLQDKTHLILSLPKIDPGEYMVEYRVLSRDGHTAPGRITFSVLLEPKP